MEDAEGSGGAATASGSKQDDEDEKEYPVLIRATDGKSKKSSKVKISTVVSFGYGYLTRGLVISLYLLLASSIHSVWRASQLVEDTVRVCFMEQSLTKLSTLSLSDALLLSSTTHSHTGPPFRLPHLFQLLRHSPQKHHDVHAEKEEGQASRCRCCWCKQEVDKGERRRRWSRFIRSSRVCRETDESDWT